MDTKQGGLLVQLARESIRARFDRSAAEKEVTRILAELDGAEAARHQGVFVTLKKGGQLRGCIGSLAAVESIRDGVAGNAVNAAFHDHRFAPVEANELAAISIEVSVLSEPQPLAYVNGEDLIRKLRSGVDGVILTKGAARATFLPQVWDQLPDPVQFLGHLCMKAGLSAACWRQDRPEISVYQVEKFAEAE